MDGGEEEGGGLEKRHIRGKRTEEQEKMKCRSGLKEKRGRRTRLSSRESEETTTERKKFGGKKKKEKISAAFQNNRTKSCNTT